MIYYTKPMHMQQDFEGICVKGDDCSNTVELCKRVLALPLHPYMMDNDIEKVTAFICRYLK